MRKYRKKPVVIEAVRVPLAGYQHRDEAQRMLDWLKSNGCQFTTPPNGVRIQTLEGDMLAEHGDYIIRGIKGELYPCKPDIFEATYKEEPTNE